MDKTEISGSTGGVRDYYDRNTARFLRWGKGGGTLNLHAALWMRGEGSLAEAMDAANELVAREIERCPFPVERVLDLGCGVGGGLFYLARRLPGVRRLIGISVSPVQIREARRRLPAGEEGRFRFEARGFLELPAAGITADFAYAIEAFSHGAAPGRFFAVQSQVLPPGGRLVLIDDFLSEERPGSGETARHHRLLERYRRNWLLPGLRPVSALKALAGRRGFALAADLDLTPFLRLRRPRDRAISLLVRCFGPWMERGTYLKSLVGGDAKQKCYAAGLIRYRLLVFEKTPPGALP